MSFYSSLEFSKSTTVNTIINIMITINITSTTKTGTGVFAHNL